MPKFYCEYCGIYLTHSSPSGRKQHVKGRKHIQNRIDFYRQVLLDMQRDGMDEQFQQLRQGMMQQQGLNADPSLFMQQMMIGGQLQVVGGLQQGGIRQIQISQPATSSEQVPSQQFMAGPVMPMGPFNPSMPIQQNFGGPMEPPMLPMQMQPLMVPPGMMPMMPTGQQELMAQSQTPNIEQMQNSMNLGENYFQ